MRDIEQVVILGGTGFIGSHLKSHFEALGLSVKVFGRDAFQSRSHLQSLVNGCDLLIMLAGANVGE
ncbi:NAD-dependent epimerase/dehydratase family protein [Hydrogenovibrio sp. SC-1]|uniref:NAD-dependent epimerase/dehydratase family protein n=1 Tax=Hydrogenovibrio sp. SC-1 TaxID=2065820 RepID=UPI001E548FF9|nr:NAD-dependent epimerase/dehydratase family protein [Hydrogenovibrio sp. SC-1]